MQPSQFINERPHLSSKERSFHAVFKNFLLYFSTPLFEAFDVISNLRKITSEFSVFNIETSYIAKVVVYLLYFVFNNLGLYSLFFPVNHFKIQLA